MPKNLSKFTLLFVSSGDLNSGKRIDSSDSLFSEEMLDFNGRSILSNNFLNGEMCKCELHLELETFSNSSDHVSNLSADSSENSSLLSGSLPDGQLNVLVSWLLDVDGGILESSLDSAEGSLDDNDSGLCGDGDSIRNRDIDFGNKMSHFCSLRFSLSLSYCN